MTIRSEGKDYWQQTALVGTVVIVDTIVCSTTCYCTHIFLIFFAGLRLRFVRGSNFRPKQNIKYNYCYFVYIFWCFGVWELLLLFFAGFNLLSTTTLQYTQRGPSQRSDPPKLARGSLGDREVWVVLGSLGGSERWLGPLCVCCKVVVESRSMRAKRNLQKNCKNKTLSSVQKAKVT